MKNDSPGGKTPVKWITADSYDGERTLKQHAVKPYTRKRAYTLEEYPGNKALCSKHGVMNESEEFISFDEVEGEPKSENCCKSCEKLTKP
jgi:hypothetical protein